MKTKIEELVTKYDNKSKQSRATGLSLIGSSQPERFDYARAKASAYKEITEDLRALLPKETVERIDYEALFAPGELEFDEYRTSGLVSASMDALRITHLPTGINVDWADMVRSKHRRRELCLEMLYTKLCRIGIKTA